MNKTILSTTGTPLNQQDNGTRGGYIALGMVGNKFAVFSLLNKQVQILGSSDLKEMNLKALFGALWCEQHYNEFDAKKEEVVFNHKRLATDTSSALSTVRMPQPAGKAMSRCRAARAISSGVSKTAPRKS